MVRKVREEKARLQDLESNLTDILTRLVNTLSNYSVIAEYCNYDLNS